MGRIKPTLLLLSWENIYDYSPLFLLPPHSTKTFLALGHFQKTTLSLQQHGQVLAGMSCGRGALTAHICQGWPHTPSELFQDEQNVVGNCGFVQQPWLSRWMVLK